MREMNTGNILPFYMSDSYTSTNVYNPVIHHCANGNYNLLPFQIILPTATYEFDIFDSTGVFVSSFTAVVKTDFTNGNSAFTYTGGTNLSSTLVNCGIYQIRVKPTGGNYTYFSEYISIKSEWDYHLFFRGTTDIGNVFYQDGYTQIAHFDGYEESPITENISKFEVTLTGAEVRTSSRRTTKRVIVGHNIINSQLSAFEGIEQSDIIALYEKSELGGVSLTNVAVSSKETDDNLSDVTITFTIDTAAKTGCGENTFTKL